VNDEGDHGAFGPPAAAGRCERCRRPRHDPLHAPVRGATFFATLVEDPDSPWAPAWIPPNHPFVAPPPSTASRLGDVLTDLDLDIPARGPVEDHAAWTDADIEEFTGLVDRWLPPEALTDPADPIAGGSRRRPGMRVLVWLVIVVLLASTAPVALAASQQDIDTAQRHLEDLEAERLALAAQEAAMRDAIAQAEDEVARLSSRADTTSERLRRVADRRNAAAAWQAATASARRSTWATIFAGEDPQEGVLTDAYVEVAVAHDGDHLGEAARLYDDAVVTLGDAEIELRTLRLELRDLQVRLETLDRQIMAAHRQVAVVRRRAGETLGLGPDVERWRPLVAKYFPSDRVDEALWMIWCESRGDPNARAWPRSSAVGLFQFLTSTWRWLAPRAHLEGARRTDPEASIAAAAWLVDFAERTHHPGGPWGPWGCRP